MISRNRGATHALFVFLALAYTCAKPAFATPSFHPAGFASVDSLSFDMEVISLPSGSPEGSNLQIFLNITNDDLQFIKADHGGFIAQFTVLVEIRALKGERLDSLKITEQVKVADISAVTSRVKLQHSRMTFQLPAGDYSVIATVTDKETNSVGVRKATASLQVFSMTEFSVSGILFFNKIERDEFGGLVFRPRVSIYQNEARKLVAYVEVYNVAAEDSFLLHLTIHDQVDSTVYEQTSWKQSHGKLTEALIEVDCKALQHGRFSAGLGVKYGDKKLNVAKSFNWFIEGFPVKLSDIHQAIEVLKYLSDKDEYQRMMSASESEKYNEFTDFWRRKDLTPLTTQNELRDEYYSRVAFTNARYGALGTEGWKTDMGWVYIMLGPPDLIDRDPYNARIGTTVRTVKATQSWTYYKQNRQLNFYDVNGFGRYLLDNPQTFYDMLR